MAIEAVAPVAATAQAMKRRRASAIDASRWDTSWRIALILRPSLLPVDVRTSQHADDYEGANFCHMAPPLQSCDPDDDTVSLCESAPGLVSDQRTVCSDDVGH